MHAINVPAKLEVRIALPACSWVNMGETKIGAVPGYAHIRGGRRGSGMVPLERVSIGSPW